MEQEKLAKSHGVLLSVMEFCPRIVALFSMKKVCFLTFSTKPYKCKIDKNDGHGKLRNGDEKVMEKCFVKSVGTLIDDYPLFEKVFFRYS